MATEEETVTEATQLTFTQKLCEITKACGQMQKSGTNSFHKYNYIKADDVSKAFRQARLEQGLNVMTTIRDQRVDLIVTAGKTECLVSIILEMTLTDGRTGLTVQAVGQGKDPGDKGAMKAFTAAYKYCIMSLCSVSEGADPEAYEETDKPVVAKVAGKATVEGNNPTPGISSLESQIEAAATLAALEALRPKVVDLNKTPGYSSLVEVYKAKKKSLETKKEGN